MPPSPPHDVPSATQLVAAVREFLTADILPAVDGRVRFHTRVAINVLGMVERELDLGPAQAAAHHDRLSSLGVSSDDELAAAIRDGSIPDDSPLHQALTRSVRDKLLVAHPDYLAGQAT